MAPTPLRRVTLAPPAKVCTEVNGGVYTEVNGGVYRCPHFNANLTSPFYPLPTPLLFTPVLTPVYPRPHPCLPSSSPPFTLVLTPCLPLSTPHVIAY